MARAKFAINDNGEFANLPMPAWNISWAPEQNAFVEPMVNAGEYRNAGAALREAMPALQQRRDAFLKPRAPRSDQAGVDARDRDEFIEVDEALRPIIEGPGGRSGQRPR